jgi:hypothetical protein
MYETGARRPAFPLPATRDAARTGLRADQTPTRIPAVPAARLGEGAKRVERDLQSVHDLLKLAGPQAQVR